MPNEFLDWSDLFLKKSLSEDEELCKADKPYKVRGAAIPGFQTQEMKNKKSTSRQRGDAGQREFDAQASRERKAREKSPEKFSAASLVSPGSQLGNIHSAGSAKLPDVDDADDVDKADVIKFDANGQWSLDKIDKKDVWHQTVAFLAAKGDPKYKALHVHLQAQKAAESGKAPPKRQLTPPNAPGTFHNQGAATRGNIGEKSVAFKKPDSEEFGRKNIKVQEQHHWKWDHNKKQWGHTHTTTSGMGLNEKTATAPKNAPAIALGTRAPDKSKIVEEPDSLAVNPSIKPTGNKG